MRYFHSKAYPIEFVLTENLDADYPTHNHARHWVLSMILCGKAVLKSGGATQDFCAGGHFVLPPYAPHSLSLDSNTRMLSICVQKEAFSRCGFDEAKSAVLTLWKKARGAFPLALEQERSLMKFAQELLELAYCAKTDTAFRDSDLRKMAKLAEMMSGEPENGYALESLARTLRVDKFRLVKNFKRHFGLPPHRFLVQARVRKAQRLLRQSPAIRTIADISADMGFYDQSHFDKAFGRIVGVSPREYQNSLVMLS